MLDTVAFGFPLAPTNSQLEEWHHRIDLHPDGRVWETYRIPIMVHGGVYAQAVYHPQDISASETKPLLKLEFSLPRIIFGNNVQIIKNVNEAIDIANKKFRGAPQIPMVDFFEGVIYRVDLCYNHMVGENVQDYILALFKLSFPQRKTLPYFGQGVQYYAKSISTKFYDKEKQCGFDRGYGVLRQEITFRDRGRIAELAGVQCPTISSMTGDFIKKNLVHDLQALKLQDQIIGDRDSASKILVDKYGPTEGDRLMGFLIRKQTMSKDQMMEKYGCSRSSINKTEKKITDAGISMALIDNKIPLPPLGIDL